jgi:RNA polymerase sigma-70 factor (ECF subfamily)
VLHSKDRVTDSQIAPLFSARSTLGLEAAYRSYGSMLRAIAYAVLGNQDDADDCVHDTFVRVWTKPNSFQSERGPLRAFLAGCVRNEALSRQRSAARKYSLEGRASELRLLIEAGCENYDPVDVARLRDAIGTLPSEQRRALELAYFTGLSHPQIAHMTGAPLGTVKGRIALALRKLTAAINP